MGAGTAGTTRTLLPRLAEQQVQYTFTDVSEFFLDRARERLADYRFVEYRLLDLEQDPGAQGFAASQYDVIVAANAVHATRDLDASLDHLRGLLPPVVCSCSTKRPRIHGGSTSRRL